MIKKTRYFIPLEGELKTDADGKHIHSGTLAELDVFHDDYEGLLLVEVEFDSIEQANAFVAPEWFGEDVTSSGKYQNSVLSKGKME